MISTKVAEAVAEAVAVEKQDRDKSINEILSERGNTYGKFLSNAEYSQSIKAILTSDRTNWNRLALDQKEALEVIAAKISRILAGNPDHVDNWKDIAGYAMLVSDRLSGKVYRYYPD
jgi:hypothetical protein